MNVRKSVYAFSIISALVCAGCSSEKDTNYHNDDNIYSTEIDNVNRYSDQLRSMFLQSGSISSQDDLSLAVNEINTHQDGISIIGPKKYGNHIVLFIKSNNNRFNCINYDSITGDGQFEIYQNKNRTSSLSKSTIKYNRYDILNASNRSGIHLIEIDNQYKTIIISRYKSYELNIERSFVDFYILIVIFLKKIHLKVYMNIFLINSDYDLTGRCAGQYFLNRPKQNDLFASVLVDGCHRHLNWLDD